MLKRMGDWCWAVLKKGGRGASDGWGITELLNPGGALEGGAEVLGCCCCCC